MHKQVIFDFENNIVFPYDILTQSHYWVKLTKFGIHKDKNIIDYSTEGLDYETVLQTLVIVSQANQTNNDFKYSQNINDYSFNNPNLISHVKLVNFNKYKKVIKQLDEWEFMHLLLPYFKTTNLSGTSNIGLKCCVSYISDGTIKYNQFMSDIIATSIGKPQNIFGIFSDENRRYQCKIKFKNREASAYIIEPFSYKNELKILNTINKIDEEIYVILRNNKFRSAMVLIKSLIRN